MCTILVKNERSKTITLSTIILTAFSYNIIPTTTFVLFNGFDGFDIILNWENMNEEWFYTFDF